MWAISSNTRPAASYLPHGGGGFSGRWVIALRESRGQDFYCLNLFGYISMILLCCVQLCLVSVEVSVSVSTLYL